VSVRHSDHRDRNPADGINQVNNMPLFEVEDAALVALQNWLTQGTQPPHSPRISTTLFFFVYDVVQRDQYGNAQAASGCRISGAD
jgi:hypothetical protein